jgi:hypothetical protein
VIEAVEGQGARCLHQRGHDQDTVGYGRRGGAEINSGLSNPVFASGGVEERRHLASRPQMCNALGCGRIDNELSIFQRQVPVA